MPLEEIKTRLQERTNYLAGMVDRHPSLLLTITYLALTIVGMSFSVFYYRQFKINYLDYSLTGDFVLAALKEPQAVLLFVASLLAFYVIYRLDFVLRRKAAWYNAMYKNRRVEHFFYHPASLIFLFLVYTLFFTQQYAQYQSEKSRTGNGQTVSLMLRLEGEHVELKRALLGTTTQFVFLYDTASRQTQVVPISSVISLSFDD